MIKMTVIRHGETDWNQKMLIQGKIDNPLNQSGINQAIEKGQQLRNQQFDIGISSNLVRASVTLQHIIDQNVNQISKVEQLALIQERDFGELEGVKVTPEIIKEITNEQNNYEYETNESIEKRAVAFLKYVETTYQNQKVLVVSHSHFIKALLVVVTKNRKMWEGKLENLDHRNFVFENNWEYQGE